MVDERELPHVSSAVVAVRPERLQDVLRQIECMPDTEVPAWQHSRLVVVFEAVNSGDVAARLARIAEMDGVVAANMVFEHAEPEKSSGA